jgi:hypothetical protein
MNIRVYFPVKKFRHFDKATVMVMEVACGEISFGLVGL